MSLPVTIGDRFAAAWKAFRQNTKPDPEAFKRWLAARDAESQASRDKLEPFDRAAVDSIAGNTTNAERLLEQVLPTIEALPFADQHQILRFIARGNPHAALYPAVSKWCSRHAAEIYAASITSRSI